MNPKNIAAILTLACFAVAAQAHEGHRHAQAAPTTAPVQAAVTQPPISEWEMMKKHLRQPEYWHVLINPIPPLGMAAGAVTIGASAVFPEAAVAGLALVAVSGAAVWPIAELGEGAYDRLFETLPPDSRQWLEVHMARAERVLWLFYFTAAFAAGAIIVRSKRPSLATASRAVTAVLAASCAVAAGWIAHAGGQVSHPEFRHGPPTAEALKIVPQKSTP